MLNVDRESANTKVRDLVNAVDDLIDEMSLNEELQRATLQITPRKMMAMQMFSLFISIITNSILLFNSGRKFHYREMDIPEWVIDSIDILGYIQMASSLILIFFFIINKKDLITKREWREFIKSN